MFVRDTKLRSGAWTFFRILNCGAESGRSSAILNCGAAAEGAERKLTAVGRRRGGAVDAFAPEGILDLDATIQAAVLEILRPQSVQTTLICVGPYMRIKPG